MEWQAKEVSSEPNAEAAVTSDSNAAPTPPYESLSLAPAIDTPSAATAAVETASSLPAPSSPRQPPPITFVNALNLQPNTGRTADVKSSAATVDNSGEDKINVTSHATLSNKFKEDPRSVLRLLQSALSLERLASLLQTEHSHDQQQLHELQQQLEDAYTTLSACTVQKEEMNDKIIDSTEKVKERRKQMEELREELKVLGEEELQLKKRRDSSYARCSELRKKLKSSREAQQQIAAFTATTGSSGNTTTYIAH